MARIICVASGKGGVGKTVTTANLCAALAEMGKSVVAVDGNLTTSNLGIHLGIPLYPVTIQDVIRGKADIREAMYKHPLGFRIIPADVSISKIMVPRTHDLIDAFYKIVKRTDFIIIDSAAGLGKEAVAAIDAADEMITVTNPEMPALTDAFKLVRIAERSATRNLGVVVNRIRGDKHEVPLSEISNFLGLPIIGKIHEDAHVRRSIAKKMPVVAYRPNCTAARQFKELASRLVREEAMEYESAPLLMRLFGWLR